MRLTQHIANEIIKNREHTPLSGYASYHLLQGNLAVYNFVTTQGFNTTLYTGKGSTQSIYTSINMNTQWGNTAEERFGGLVWIKTRNVTNNNVFTDTVRGATKTIYSDLTNAEAIYTGGLTAFNTNGFSLGNSSGFNTSTNTHVSWNFQTTHRISGTTNHGKAYTCHYNPFTGFTIVKYEGSGIAGHEIPHHLGRKLGFVTIKNLSAVVGWATYIPELDSNAYLYLNTADSKGTGSATDCNSSNVVINHTVNVSNTSANQYIMYGWANSYYDGSNKLIGNYEIGVYQGTGVSGNKVATRGKPAWVMIKRTDSAGYWVIFDNKRGSDFQNYLYANSSVVEGSAANFIDALSDGFNVNLADNNLNASGGQYLYMVVYDTNSNGGGSFYEKTTDNANVQINNAIIPLAKGFDSNGAKNEIVVANETITGVTWEEGKNYPYRTTTGYGVSRTRPSYGNKNEYDGRSFFNINSNYWDNPLLENMQEISVLSDTTKINKTTDVFGSNTASEFTVSSDIGSIMVTPSTLPSTGNYLVSCYYKKGTNATNYASMYFSYYGGTDVTVYFDLANLTSTKSDCYVEKVNDEWYKLVTKLNIPDGQTDLSGSIFLRGSIASTSSLTTVIGHKYYVSHWTLYDLNGNSVESRNYMNHIVHADSQGNPLFVEELPKVKYENIVKADEVRGKNACTAWVNFDGTTTPPTIRDSYNVSKVIRIATGIYDVYFKEPMDNIGYSFTGDAGLVGLDAINHLYRTCSEHKGIGYRTINKVMVITGYIYSGGQSLENQDFIDIQIFGGKN